MPRGIDARLRWMLDNPPGVAGMCARTCWQALGSDVPAWGAADANAVYAKVVASGRYWRTDPPRGALVVWRYGRHGHVALAAGGGRIVTTDPSGKPGGTGYESLTYPHKWGASSSARLWTDQYNGVRFPVATDEGDDDMPSAEQIADAIWNDDVVPSPTGKDSPNPTWRAGSYLLEILEALQRIEKKLP